MNIEIVNADIFSVKVEAIVNPANKQASLWFGSHINDRIRKTAGKSVIKERKEKGDINLGDAVFTSGGNLPVKYIIHAAILDMFDFNPLFLLKLKQRTKDEVLKNATINSLKIADKLKIASLAFSPMGAGIGAMKMEKCAKIMLLEMVNFISSKTSSPKIIFCVRGKKDYSIVKSAM
jgi:O-acetyl-ADP-ribose deacetylase (regulator of RNase III)